MQFLCVPTKVWENDLISFSIQTADDGTIWVHVPELKVKITKTTANGLYLALCDFFETIKATFGVDKMYAWCPRPDVLKWAKYNGWCEAGTFTHDGGTFPIVEFE